MNVSEILKRVEKVDTKANYWFVRTDYGKHFEEFVDGEYIAIGWDYLTLHEINNLSQDYVKNKISEEDKIDIRKSSGKSKVTSTFNKLKTFISLKKDDIIVIPSRNSDMLSFGQIVDDEPYEELNAKTFLKRRKVKWIITKSIKDLNPIFYKVKSNQHTISRIDSYAPHIDRVVGTLFKKGDNTHFVLNIDQTDDINFEDLKKLMDNINILVRNINKELDFNENLDEFYIKINLQSKGAVELIKSGKSLAVLAFLMHSASCNSLDDVKDDNLRTIIQNNRSTLDSTNNVIDTMKLNASALSKPFKHGN